MNVRRRLPKSAKSGHRESQLGVLGGNILFSVSLYISTHLVRLIAFWDFAQHSTLFQIGISRFFVQSTGQKERSMHQKKDNKISNNNLF